jgi:hypothetical protein
MSKCNFSIQFSGSADVLVQKAKTAITSNGGQFDGDESSGAFIISTPVGKVSGYYAVDGQNFNIGIEDKPFLVSCSKIENTLKDALAAGV